MMKPFIMLKKRYINSFILLSLLTLSLNCIAFDGNNPNPATRLQASISKVIDFMAQSQDASLEDVSPFLAKEIAPYFDLEYMSRWVAGQHFKQMSKAQQQEFIKTFGELFILTFVQKISAYDQHPPKVDKVKSKRTGKNEALVSLHIIQEDDHFIQVDFKFLKSKKTWKVVDIRANGLSALNHYRKYFKKKLYQKRQQNAVFN